MTEELKIFEEKMQKSLDSLHENYNGIRAGRANPHILDKVKVDYYGVPTPIQQCGNIAVPEARIMTITPWDKSLLKAIEKAINMSDIGINPTNDGSVIRLVFPELNEERRKDLTKQIKKYAEDSKVAIRNIRRDANDKIKKMEKAGEMTEDDVKQAEEDMQKATDKFIKTIDNDCDEKCKDIMKV